VSDRLYVVAVGLLWALFFVVVAWLPGLMA
jgi:hypothetical protein